MQSSSISSSTNEKDNSQWVSHLAWFYLRWDDCLSVFLGLRWRCRPLLPICWQDPSCSCGTAFLSRRSDRGCASAGEVRFSHFQLSEGRNMVYHHTWVKSYLTAFRLRFSFILHTINHLPSVQLLQFLCCAVIQPRVSSWSKSHCRKSPQFVLCTVFTNEDIPKKRFGRFCKVYLTSKYIFVAKIWLSRYTNIHTHTLCLIMKLSVSVWSRCFSCSVFWCQ